MFGASTVSTSMSISAGRDEKGEVEEPAGVILSVESRRWAKGQKEELTRL